MAGERFRIVEGGLPRKPRRKPGSKSTWECRVCEPIQGVRSRYLVKVRQGALEGADGKITGGRDVWVCSICMLRGVFTPVTS